MRRLAALAVVLFVAGCGSFGPAQPQKLSLGFKTGDTYKYRFHAASKQTAGMGGMTAPVTVDTTADETVKVNSVDSSGVADLTITLGNYTFKTVAAGVTNTTTGIPQSSIDVKVGRDGTIASVDGSAVAAANPLAALTGIGGGFFISAVLPANAVKPGDTWSRTYDQNLGTSNVKIHVVSESKYVRDDTVNNVRTAVVETRSTGSIDTTAAPTPAPDRFGGTTVKGTFTTDVTTWIDPSGRRILKTHSTAHDDVTITFPTPSPPVTDSNQNMPMLEGPITAVGDTTTDLTPA